MSKRFLISAIVIVLVGIGLTYFLSRNEDPGTNLTLSKKEIAKKYAEVAARLGRPNVPTEAVLKPLDLSQPVRLAIGGLGLADNDQNEQLGDLITADLTGTPGFTLVERQSLDAILQELNLSLSGFVRASDAVRVGKLLKVDWFLLGTRAKINGTNSLVVRVVDARTGVMRDAGAFPSDKPSVQLAADLAGFIKQSRQDAASAKLCVYLAVGSFEDLSVNNRRADFPTQLRGYLTFAYQGGKVTLLERDYLDTLLREVHLDMAGLTEDSDTNPSPPMQSAFWLISGQYQSYETTNFQVEVNFDVQRIFGSNKHFALRGQPGEPICRQIKQAIDSIMNQNQKIIIPTRTTEIRAQMDSGKELANLGPIGLINPVYYQNLDGQEAARHRRNAEEAIKAFETVLLLDPGSREAKLYLAACLLKPTIDRTDEARNYYREVLEEPIQDKWAGQAEQALVESFYWASSQEKFRWFSMAISKNTNIAVADFYAQQEKAAETDVVIQSGDSPQARELSEKQLFDKIAATFNAMQTGIGTFYGASEMWDFIQTYGNDRPADGLSRLVELYPKMKVDFPQLAPQLLEWVVTYQTDTNTPLLAELNRTLDWEIAHPDEVYKSKYFAVDSGVYQWSMEKGLYSVALKVLDRDRIVNGVNKTRQLSDKDKISLGYAYADAKRWNDALSIFESFSNCPVMMVENGPWGGGYTPVLPSKCVAYCREKLGLPVLGNLLEFDMGKPLFCLCSPSTFTTDENGLWIGINGQLMQLDFDLKTNLVIDLPMDPSTRISSMCVSSSNIWIGTIGDGLIEFDKHSHKSHRFTVEDGLMMNGISCLHLTKDSLWIGYGNQYGIHGLAIEQPSGGGLGLLELSSGKFTSFTPSIETGTEAQKKTSGNMVLESTDNPTRRAIRVIAAGPKGNIWFTTDFHPLRRYRIRENDWSGIPGVMNCSSLAADENHLFAGLFWNYNFGNQNKTGPLGVSLLNIKAGQWQSLNGLDGLPSGVVTTLALDGKYLLVGGMGYIALVDPVQNKILKYTYVQTPTVDHIEVAGGYVWAQFDWHLYRAPLSALQ